MENIERTLDVLICDDEFYNSKQIARIFGAPISTVRRTLQKIDFIKIGRTKLFSGRDIKQTLFNRCGYDSLQVHHKQKAKRKHRLPGRNSESNIGEKIAAIKQSIKNDFSKSEVKC